MNDLPRPSPARADLRLALGKSLESSLHRLDNLWHDIGFSEEEKCQRTKAVFEHVHSLLDDLCSEEEEGRKKLKESADQHTVEYAKLCKELSVRDEPLPSNLSLLAREGELRHRVSELQKERHRRVSKSRSLVAQEENLCSSLCKERQLEHVTRDFVPSVEQLQRWQELVNHLMAEKDQRILQLSDLQQKLQQLWSDLEREPLDDSIEKAFSSCDVEDMVLTDEAIERGRALVQKLEKEVKILTEMADSLRSQIVLLGKRLDIPPNEQDAFLQEHSGHKASTIAAMEVELDRLTELKRQHMGRFIQAVREELTVLWDRAHFGPKQREEFIPAHDTEFTEELLVEHEQEAQRIRSFLDENAAIFQMVERHEQLCARMEEINASAKNPNRFNNRGGQLLKEEKMRKALTRELPKVEKELKALLIDWEEQKQEHFVINDERYLDVMQSENGDSKREQDRKRLAVKKSAAQDDHSRGNHQPVTPVKRRLPLSSAAPATKKLTTTPSVVGNKSRPASARAKTPSRQNSTKSIKSAGQPSAASSRPPLRDHNPMEASVAIAGNVCDVECTIASVSTLSYNDFVQTAMSGQRSSSIERPEDLQKMLFDEG